MAPDTLYESRPGGTIVRLADGTATQATYGQAYVGDLAPEKLDPQVAAELTSHADATPRISAQDQGLAAARDAHQRAALNEGGQPGSSQSPVPGNYSELDEDGASRLVSMLDGYPEQQASVVMHEILYAGNRRKVVDAAGDYARVAAMSRIAALTPAQAPANPADGVGAPVTSPGDPGIQDQTGTLPRSVRPFDQRVAAALGVNALRQGVEAQVAAAAEAPAPEDGPRNLTRDEVAGLRAENADLNARLAALESTLATADVDRSDDVQNGEPAAGFDGAEPDKGSASEGYWTNQELKNYAAQHEVDVSGAGNREQLKARLAAGGHAAPQTPKPS